MHVYNHGHQSVIKILYIQYHDFQKRSSQEGWESFVLFGILYTQCAAHGVQHQQAQIMKRRVIVDRGVHVASGFFFFSFLGKLSGKEQMNWEIVHRYLHLNQGKHVNQTIVLLRSMRSIYR